MTESESILLENLKVSIEVFEKTLRNLNYSHERIRLIDINAKLSDDELEYLDSAMVRYLRHYEVFYNQLIKTSLMVLGEYKTSFLDNLNEAEKQKIIWIRKL